MLSTATLQRIYFETSAQLGLIKIIDTIEKHEIVNKYDKLFKGIGKLKDKEIHLFVDETVVPVAQKARRIAFNIRPQVEEE